MNEPVDIEIREVTTYSDSIASSLRLLVKQLDDHFQPLTTHDIQSLLASDSTHLYIAYIKGTNEVIGMITLVIYRIPYKKKALIEDIVVDELYRKQGIGKKLLAYAINSAKKEQVKTIDLTSQPMRESANQLYQHMGFVKRETNMYRMIFE
jgi:ribosomal protein S18 acetylase RimI-like enzyme